MREKTAESRVQFFLGAKCKGQDDFIIDYSVFLLRLSVEKITIFSPLNMDRATFFCLSTNIIRVCHGT